MIASTMSLYGNEETIMMMFVMMTKLTGASMNLCTRAALLTLTSFTLQYKKGEEGGVKNTPKMWTYN